ncbi:MAG TPA: hypothetical protein VGX78_00335 [Pirellulales bacterium]|jgi:hypothetical protein|nr:hypothetical protein [Pirellulales bacterium]
MSQAVEWATDEVRRLPPPRRRGWGRYAIWALFFATGMVCGAMGAVIVVDRDMQREVAQPSHDWPRRMLESMNKELDLTSEQTAQVERIVELHRKAIGKIWGDVRPRFDAELKTMEGQVAGVLSDDQKQRWHEYLETRRRRACAHAGDATHANETGPSGKAKQPNLR